MGGYASRRSARECSRKFALTGRRMERVVTLGVVESGGLLLLLLRNLRQAGTAARSARTNEATLMHPRIGSHLGGSRKMVSSRESAGRHASEDANVVANEMTFLLPFRSSTGIPVTMGESPNQLAVLRETRFAVEKPTIIHGDALQVLRRLESGCVQCIVTSPPYWGLREKCVNCRKAEARPKGINFLLL